tara:strand:- start:359 stop:1807 length:1449 start_codon:yes stop_codon:yes gene_type:complete
MIPIGIAAAGGGILVQKLAANYLADGNLSGFDMESYKQSLQQFANSMQFGEGLQCHKSFESYEKNHASALSDMPDIKIAGEKTLQQAINNPPNGVRNISDDFASIFALNDATIQARVAFEEELENLDKAIKDPKVGINPYALSKHIQDLKITTQEIINAQHESELERLEEKFKDPDFTQALCDAAKVTKTDKQVNELKETITGKIKEQHAKQLETAVKPLTDSHIELENHLQKDRDRIFLLATMYKDKEMKKMIDALADKNANDRNCVIDVKAGDKEPEKDPTAVFKGIKIEDLEYLKTTTGRKLEKHGDGYRMILPTYFSFESSMKYYSQYSTKMREDFQSMAMVIRAQGYNSITTNVKHGNQETAIKMGQAAFEGNMLAGFDENKITVNVNGQKLKVEELFKDNPEKLQKIRNQAAQRSEERKRANAEANSLLSNTGTDQYRSKIRDIRDGIRNNEQKDKEALSSSQTEPTTNSPGTGSV